MMLAKATANPRAWLTLILVCYVLVAGTFSLNMPLFEGGDEHAHFEYVLSLARGQGLPVQQARQGLLNYQAHHPPLYYLMSALAIWWIDSADYRSLMVVNPYSDYDPLALSNKNLYLHGRREAFPFLGAALAMHLARLVSVAAGAGAVAATFALAKTLLPVRPDVWVGAAAFVAFVPQFGSTSGTINNDSVAVLTVTLALVQLARMAIGAAMPSPRQWVVLGALIGLALLSKETGLLLVPCAALVLAAVAARRGWGLRRSIAGVARALVPAIALTGWWYAVRYEALGFLFGSPGLRVPPAELFYWNRLVDHWTESEISFWGLFGWNVVALPQTAYDLLHWLALIGLAGLGLWLWRWKERSTADRLAIAVLSLWVLLVAMGYASWVSASAQPHGRLVFPALPALAILLSIGWSQWAPRAWRPVVLFAVAASMCCLAAWSATVLMDEAYPSPQFVSEAAPDLRQLNLNLSDQVTIAGYRAETRSTPAGAIATVDLVWDVRAQPKADYTVSLQLFDERGTRIGHLDTYPVSGMYLTSEWEPGKMFRESYRLFLTPSAGGGRSARVTIGLYDRGTGAALRVIHADGRQTARVDLGTLDLPGQ